MRNILIYKDSNKNTWSQFQELWDKDEKINTDLEKICYCRFRDENEIEKRSWDFIFEIWLPIIILNLEIRKIIRMR